MCMDRRFHAMKRLNDKENLMTVKDNELLWAKANSKAIIPTKRDEDAGYDIYPCIKENYIEIKPHETRLIPTGIAVAVAENYYLQVEERGSLGSKGIKVSAGIIDSGYRGEVFIAITNTNTVDFIICGRGVSTFKNEDIILLNDKAIAQLIVHRVHKMKEREVEYYELVSIPSCRGTGKCGSSGK